MYWWAGDYWMTSSASSSISRQSRDLAPPPWPHPPWLTTWPHPEVGSACQKGEGVCPQTGSGGRDHPLQAGFAQRHIRSRRTKPYASSSANSGPSTPHRRRENLGLCPWNDLDFYEGKSTYTKYNVIVPEDHAITLSNDSWYHSQTSWKITSYKVL
jgi:hypothetical protein